MSVSYLYIPYYICYFFVNFNLDKKVSTREGKADTESAEEDDDSKSGTIRLTKAERRVKLKKERKDTKKINKDEDIAPDSPKEKLQSEVLVICFSNLFVIIIVIIAISFFVSVPI